MSVELHLPDLPEIQLSLGPPPAAPGQRPHVRRGWRLRDSLSTYLPLLLMALLALATWWLVKNAPQPQAAPAARAVSAEPDYVMNRFALERFDNTGKLSLRIEGAELRHYPDTDRIEIDRSQIKAFSPDGPPTIAVSQRAVGQGDGSELQLIGAAEVVSTDRAGTRLSMQGEMLQAFTQLQRVVSNKPVVVTHGDSVLRAGGLRYDHGSGVLQLTGPVRATLQPRAAPMPATLAPVVRLSTPP